MIYHESHHCLECGADSSVRNTRGVFRYRRCSNPLCRATWRTQEIRQEEADELAVWKLQQDRETAPSMQEMLNQLTNLQGSVVELVSALGLEVDNGTGV